VVSKLDSTWQRLGGINAGNKTSFHVIFIDINAGVGLGEFIKGQMHFFSVSAKWTF